MNVINFCAREIVQLELTTRQNIKPSVLMNEKEQLLKKKLTTNIHSIHTIQDTVANTKIETLPPFQITANIQLDTTLFLVSSRYLDKFTWNDGPVAQIE